MTLNEKIEFLKLMGFNDDNAEAYANQDEKDEVFALIAGLRFLRASDSSLEHTKTNYADFIKNNSKYTSDVEKKILELGVAPELLAEFKYEIEHNIIYSMLYNLSDYASADNDENTSNEYAKMCDNAPYCRLIEMIGDKPTGRYITELHQFFPFDNDRN